MGTASIVRLYANYAERSGLTGCLDKQVSLVSYSVEQGATWDLGIVLNICYTHTDGFGGNNRMNSFNHYSFGAVRVFGCTIVLLGIQRDEAYAGFKHFNY